MTSRFLVRFFNYIGDIIFHFSLGTSYQSRQPVITDIMARFPNTLLLTVFSMSIASILGISLGILLRSDSIPYWIIPWWS